jgi:transcriptional regulator with XRE-family HTH domain
MNTIIAHHLRAKRKEKRLTQRQVAEKVYVSRGLYSNFERGEREPRLTTFIQLCKLLSIDLTILS